MADIKYEIKERLCVLRDNNNGWTKELNLISWNVIEPKYDILEWDQEHSKTGKGVTLSKKEFEELKCLLNELTF